MDQENNELVQGSMYWMLPDFCTKETSTKETKKRPGYQGPNLAHTLVPMVSASPTLHTILRAKDGIGDTHPAMPPTHFRALNLSRRTRQPFLPALSLLHHGHGLVVLLETSWSRHLHMLVVK